MTIKKTVRRSQKLATKVTATKTSLNRSKTGKASAAKGKQFEDQVADLYRLLGAKVVQNIEIHHKKVDILATFQIPGSSHRHTVIVECKDEGRAVAANQRIMAFKGLLDVARGSGSADSAEIITRTPWSDQAKGFASSSGVELLTYTEKVSQLIDLTTYMKNLATRFDKHDPARPSDPPLGSYYVDLSAEKGTNNASTRIPVIDSYIRKWISNANTNKQLAIFGEYGSGKSTLCQKLARDLADAYLNESKPKRIPILLNLRDFIGKLDLEAYITSFLDRECNVVNPRIELFRAMNEAGIFLLIFDGFDEMAVKVDADTLESNLLEIEKLVASQNSKLMLTSRPEYFISAREESEVLNPIVNPFLNRATQYEPLKILPWNEQQVELFLQKRVPLVKGADQPWTYYRDRIKRIGSLGDLSQRPVLLDMIVKTLPRLIASGETINLPNLYKSYLLGEMKRQKILKKRSFLLSDNTRLELLQELAVQIYNAPTQSTTFGDALLLVEKEIDPPKHELEAHTRDFLTNSFLIRSGDEYRLSHKSILEFLVALKLSSEIQSDSPTVFKWLNLDYQIEKFLTKLDPNQETLLRWIQKTRTAKFSQSHLGKNAAHLLLRVRPGSLAGRDLSGTNLSGLVAFDADLRKCNFHKTLLKDADLTGAKFYKADIESAFLDDTWISFYVLKNSETMNYDLEMFINFATKKLLKLGKKREQISFRFPMDFEEHQISEIVLAVPGMVEIERTKDKMKSLFKSNSVAVFFEEYEQLSDHKNWERQYRILFEASVNIGWKSRSRNDKN